MNPSNTPTKSNGIVFKTLVLGHRGFIGGFLTNHLQKKGFDVLGASSQECDLLQEKQAARFFATAPEKLRIIFCAGMTRKADPSFDSMVRNIRMIHNLAQILPSRKLESLVYLSSVDVYGSDPALPVTEATPVAPDNFYGIGKFIGELLLRKANRIGSPVSILRLPGVYGPGDGMTSVISHFYTQIKGKNHVDIVGNPQTRRDFLPVAFLCKVIERLLKNPVNDVLNIAMGESLAMVGWVRLLSEEMGCNPKIDIKPSKTANSDLVFDVARLKAQIPGLSFKPARKSIQDYVISMSRKKESFKTDE